MLSEADHAEAARLVGILARASSETAGATLATVAAVAPPAFAPLVATGHGGGALRDLVRLAVALPARVGAAAAHAAVGLLRIGAATRSLEALSLGFTWALRAGMSTRLDADVAAAADVWLPAYESAAASDCLAWLAGHSCRGTEKPCGCVAVHPRRRKWTCLWCTRANGATFSECGECGASSVPETRGRALERQERCGIMALRRRAVVRAKLYLPAARRELRTPIPAHTDPRSPRRCLGSCSTWPHRCRRR